MEVLIISFLAGFLTVLSPCILPVLPVVLGGALRTRSWSKPLIIIGALSVSIFGFTLLLKASTLLIDIPFSIWTAISGVIVFIFGVFLLFPQIWDWISFKLKLYRSEGLIQGAKQKEGVWGDILLGLALGPIFSSCSPTYALIIATILPQSLQLGIINLAAYSIGLMIPLLLIAYGGQFAVNRMKFLANPNGLFKKILGVLLIIVGIAIASGIDKKIETWLVENGYLGTTALEQSFVEGLDEKMLDMVDEKEDKSMTKSNDKMSTEKKANPTKLFAFEHNYTAPELVGLQKWFNSSPLTLEALKGKVVLVDFWTFSCINCIRTLPYIRDLHEKYGDKGLLILGIHTPEFAFEKKPENVQNALDEYGLKYPVAMDNNYETWRAFRNRYWPAKYLIDVHGNVRYTHFGEGQYEETEKAVQALLTEVEGFEMPTDMEFSKGEEVDFASIQTPEIYFGHLRQDHFGGGNYVPDEVTTFTLPEKIENNTFYLEGDWRIEDEKAVLVSSKGKIVIRYHAKKANIVLGAPETSAVEGIVRLNGKQLTDGQAGADIINNDGIEASIIGIDEHTLYNFTDVEGDVEWRTLEVEFNYPGVEAYAFTFG